jgi:uncharacterized protein DUF4012
MRVAAAAFVALALIAAGAASVAFGTLGLREELQEGRRALELGRRALLDGRATDATASFEEARDAFDAAENEAASGLAAVGRLVPVLGRTADVAAALADAGGHAAAAGLALSTSIEDIPGGLGALAPTGGALPVEAVASLAGPFEDARSEAARGTATIRSSPDTFLLGPATEVRLQALDRFEEIDRLLDAAHAFTLGLPAFAGADRPRRYLFLAENPAEPRGTGGLWGAFAILRVERGRFGFSSFRPVQTIGSLPPDEVPAPNPNYRRNYDQFGGAGHWVSMNLTPDFPSAARAALATWEAVGRRPLDGVISADPFALRSLLTVTGALRLERPSLLVTAGNVVPLLSNLGYARFPDSSVRKALLGEVARAVFDRFMKLDGRPLPRLRAIGGAIADQHLKIYTVDPSMQEALVRAELDGGLRANGGDLLAVVVNAGAGAKVDFFARRTVHHEVTLLPDAASTALTVTTIRNDAPASGQPAYVIGPGLGRPGDNIPLISVFCGPTCRLVRADRGGDRISVFTGSELGYRFYQDYFTIPSGRTGKLAIRTETPGSWRGDVLGGTYHLTVLAQTTIRPTHATVRIKAPPGMRFTRWSEGIRAVDDVATWAGILDRKLELEVSFEAPALPVRLWRFLSERF